MGAKKIKRSLKVSKSEVFSLSGPVHLTTVNWNDMHHRRSVAASLVKGTYTLERDRQRNRQGPQALAPPWWDFFQFKLFRVLVDTDLSIFGAIYEFKFPGYCCDSLASNPPRYVVAFRGTITKRETRSQDLKLDLQLLRNKLSHSPRFRIAMQAVQSMATMAGAANIWLAGHSLGSAVALLAGKNMVKKSYPIETFLFNPPFCSAPVELFKNEKVKHGIRFASSVIKAGVAVAVKDNLQRRQQHDSFIALSAWIPNLFVNPSDPICSEYIGYFEHRENMMEIGAGKIERLATQNSIANLLLGKHPEPLHLLPSASLTINLKPSQIFKQDHGINQWLEPNLSSQAKIHQFRWCYLVHETNLV